jgi:DNA-binding NarL/FixJ family response regulator
MPVSKYHASERKRLERAAAGPLAIVALQVVAAAYLVIDGLEDVLQQASKGFSLEIAMECLVALALLAGVIMGSRYIGRMTRELRWKEQLLANARGALGEHIVLRFAEWGLTPGEGEVALFALKGCDVAEIARLRNSAPGTVRSQLSQIYTKAGVGSHAMLMSLFIEDLLDVNPSA